MINKNHFLNSFKVCENSEYDIKIQQFIVNFNLVWVLTLHQSQKHHHFCLRRLHSM